MIQDGILRFSYRGDAGKMAIVLDSFFPASGKKLRILLKTIDLSGDRFEIRRELMEWLQNRYESGRVDAKLRDYANSCVDCRTKAKEMEEPILKQAEQIRKIEDYIKSLKRGDPQKKPLREKLKAEKQKLNSLKEKQRGFEKDAKYYNGLFIKQQAAKKKAEENLEIIRNWQFSFAW